MSDTCVQRESNCRETRLQRDYYASTAPHYDAMHLSAGDEHHVALRYVSALMREFDLNSVLDVGTGTGRAVVYLRHAHPGAFVVGVEPVESLLARARAKMDVTGAGLVSASGYRLPFADTSFDAVCQFGVLHHVKDPNVVVGEMMRVAKRAVLLSDSNRFGQGSIRARLVKLLLAHCGLWPAANFLKTRGAGYTISAGDGLSYSYSVFDSFDTLQAWADHLVLVPTSPVKHATWMHPLLTSSHVLLCALRDR
jgi:ubiquinone/menaquinone biosynthesis C-methylase UbiE